VLYSYTTVTFALFFVHFIPSVGGFSVALLSKVDKSTRLTSEIPSLFISPPKIMKPIFLQYNSIC
jgi:hypothetical protein